MSILASKNQVGLAKMGFYVVGSAVYSPQISGSDVPCFAPIQRGGP
jgi:hypothetical protein